MTKKSKRLAEFMEAQRQAFQYMRSQGYSPRSWVASLMAHFAAKKKRRVR